MNEIVVGVIAPIVLYGNPQGIWTPIPNVIGLPNQPADVYYGDSFAPDVQLNYEDLLD